MDGSGDDQLIGILTAGQHGVLATVKRDGWPQLSNVSYTYDHDTGLVRVSTVETLAKARNVRRDARASLHVTTGDFGAYAVAEGDAELTPVASAPGDATVDELVEVYRAIAGEHPDWDEYRAAMVADRRVVLRLRVGRVYGRVVWGS